jgi:hypothetical protein
MALNVGLDASFDNMQDLKGTREKLESLHTNDYEALSIPEHYTLILAEISLNLQGKLIVKSLCLTN